MNKRSSHSRALYCEIQEIINSYAQGLGVLAQRSGIPKSTLWRWQNLKNKNGPNPHTLMALLKCISKKSELHEVVEFFGGETGTFIKNAFALEYEKKLSFQYDYHGQELITDFYTYLIFMVCGTESGIAQEKLIKLIGFVSLEKLGIDSTDASEQLLESLGEHAQKRIDFLLQKEVLCLSQQGILSRTQKRIKIDLQLTKKYVPQMLSFFKPNQLNENKNLLYCYQESISDKGIQEILKIQYDAFFASYKVMEREKCKEGTPYFLMNFFDSIDYDIREKGD